MIATKTSFCFQLIKWQQVPNTDRYVTEWLLVIDDLDTLELYLGKRGKSLMGTYYKMKKKNKKYTGHCASKDELMLETALEHKKGRMTFVDDCTCIADEIMSPYAKIFLLDSVIYICDNDCIRPIKSVKKDILKTVNKEIFTWPTEKYTKEDINITKWPGGKHYFAKIGSITVEDEYGNTKWNTVEEAERQAEIFLRKIEHEETKNN